MPFGDNNDKKLSRILKTMDLPWNRKKEFTPHKLRWLKKNIGKRNCEHENFQESIELIDKMLE